MAGLRIKGQEVSIRIIQDGAEVTTIDSIGAFNTETSFELKEDGFLGEPTNRFDEVLNGFGGDFEQQFTSSGWIRFAQAVEDRATRRNPAIVFNIVRTDLFPDGSSIVYTYQDVKWGPISDSIGARGDFVKGRASFKCSQRDVQRDAV